MADGPKVEELLDENERLRHALANAEARLAELSMHDAPEETRAPSTDRVRLRAERDALLARLSLIIEQMPIACIVRDAELRIVEFNPAAERVFGFRKKHVTGSPPFELAVPAHAKGAADGMVQDLVRGGRYAHAVLENIRRDGKTILCEWHDAAIRGPDGAFLGLIAMCIDITEQRRLQEQLLQSQKMEAVGLLAGGIAHDFNNTLSIISGYSELISDELPAGSPLTNDLAEIAQAAQRAGLLTKQLLAFSRKQVLKPRVVDLNVLVVEIEKMLRRVIGEDVVLETRLAHDLARVKVDPHQVTQVLVNLAVNARDAMPNGGHLTVETENTSLAAECPFAAVPGFAPGSYVRLSVKDTGEGISDEVREKIFEPFFTTKGPGRGTGLGLSTVYGIVTQSGGFVRVESEIGKGACFEIVFPPYDGPQSTGSVPAPTTRGAHGTETILLVEDEPEVRKFAERALERLGYRVLSAAGPDEALRLFEAYGAHVHLLLTDVVMPKMNGRLLAERAKVKYPDISVLFMSGYAEGFVNAAPDDDAELLQKPLLASTLGSKVREVLDRAARARLLAAAKKSD